MLHRGVFVCFLLGMLIILPLVLLAPQPVLAAADSYVNRYLQASEPVALELDSQGHTRLFSAFDLSAGKVLFEHKAELAKAHPSGADLDRATGSKTDPVPLHPGARTYFDGG